MTSSLVRTRSSNGARSPLEGALHEPLQESSTSGPALHSFMWLGTRDQRDIVSLDARRVELYVTIGGAAEVLLRPLGRCTAESATQFNIVPPDWPELPPRVLVETLAREFFGPSASVRYYRVDGEDETLDVAEIGADVREAELLAEIEERLLSRIVERHPQVLNQLTIVCHRR